MNTSVSCAARRDSSADKALDARREAIADYHQNRVRAMAAEPGNYRPLAPDALLRRREHITSFFRTALVP